MIFGRSIFGLVITSPRSSSAIIIMIFGDSNISFLIYTHPIQLFKYRGGKIVGFFEINIYLISSNAACRLDKIVPEIKINIIPMSKNGKENTLGESSIYIK